MSAIRTDANAGAAAQAAVQQTLYAEKYMQQATEAQTPTHDKAGVGAALFLSPTGLAALGAMALTGATVLAVRAVALGPEQAARDLETIKSGVQALKDQVSVLMEEKAELSPEERAKLTEELAKLERWAKDAHIDNPPESARGSSRGIDAWMDYVEGMGTRIAKLKEKLGMLAVAVTGAAGAVMESSGEERIAELEAELNKPWPHLPHRQAEDAYLDHRDRLRAEIAAIKEKLGLK